MYFLKVQLKYAQVRVTSHFSQPEKNGYGLNFYWKLSAFPRFTSRGLGSICLKSGNFRFHRNKCFFFIPEDLTISILRTHSADEKSMIFFLSFFFPSENCVWISCKLCILETLCIKYQNFIFWKKYEYKYFKMQPAEIYTHHAKCQPLKY